MLLISTLLSLVCEEDGTEVDSDEFLMALPDNTVLMALEPGQTWKPQPVCVCVLVSHLRLIRVSEYQSLINHISVSAFSL